MQIPVVFANDEPAIRFDGALRLDTERCATWQGGETGGGTHPYGPVLAPPGKMRGTTTHILRETLRAFLTLHIIGSNIFVLKSGMKYFRVEDYSALPFKANGTGLSASLVAVAKVIPTQTFELPIFPSAVYLLGVVFAFGVHARAMLLNDDIHSRERLNHAREFIGSALESEHLTPELESMLDQLGDAAAEQHKRLLSAPATRRIEVFSAYCYFISLGCFLVATGYAIYFLS